MTKCTTIGHGEDDANKNNDYCEHSARPCSPSLYSVWNEVLSREYNRLLAG